ncbi:MAG: hypothetical protein J0L57_02710 [Burkholderiales bacterium]|nr:hypothetical protein [Burkholderiales bacterium]
MTAASGIAALALLAGLAFWLGPLDPGIVQLQFAATPRAFAAIVHAWGPEGLARYRAHFAVDFALLGCYAVFGWRLARRTAVFAGLPMRGRSVAAWALPAAALADAAENTLHLWLTAAPRFSPAWPYALAAACAAAKWLLLIGFAALLAWALARPQPGAR